MKVSFVWLAMLPAQLWSVLHDPLGSRHGTRPGQALRKARTDGDRRCGGCFNLKAAPPDRLARNNQPALRV